MFENTRLLAVIQHHAERYLSSFPEVADVLNACFINVWDSFFSVPTDPPHSSNMLYLQTWHTYEHTGQKCVSLARMKWGLRKLQQAMDMWDMWGNVEKDRLGASDKCPCSRASTHLSTKNIFPLASQSEPTVRDSGLKEDDYGQRVPER